MNSFIWKLPLILSDFVQHKILCRIFKKYTFNQIAYAKLNMLNFRCFNIMVANMCRDVASMLWKNILDILCEY